jgi:hypothetical protein
MFHKMPFKPKVHSEHLLCSKRLWFKTIVQRHDPSTVSERNVFISMYFFPCFEGLIFVQFQKICFLHVSYKFMPMFLSCFYHVYHRFLFQLYMFEGNVGKDRIISFKHPPAFR